MDSGGQRHSAESTHGTTNAKNRSPTTRKSAEAHDSHQQSRESDRKGSTSAETSSSRLDAPSHHPTKTIIKQTVKKDPIGSNGRESTSNPQQASLFDQFSSLTRSAQHWYAKMFPPVETKEILDGDKQGALNHSTEEELKKLFLENKETFKESWERAEMPEKPYGPYEKVTLSDSIHVVDVPTVRTKLQPRISAGIADAWRKYGPYLKLCEIGGTGYRIVKRPKKEERLQVYEIPKGSIPQPPPSKKPIMTSAEVEYRLLERQKQQPAKQNEPNKNTRSSSNESKMQKLDQNNNHVHRKGSKEGVSKNITRTLLNRVPQIGFKKKSGNHRHKSASSPRRPKKHQ